MHKFSFRLVIFFLNTVVLCRIYIYAVVKKILTPTWLGERESVRRGMTAAYPFHDLSDQVWERLRPLLPGEAGRRGRSAQDNRRFLNAVFWILLTGAPWRDLPPQYGGWKNTHRRFCRWRDRGVWASILDSLNDARALEWPMTIIASRLRSRLREAGAPAGNQALALIPGHLPHSPSDALNQVASATLPGSSGAQTMRDGTGGKKCRRCRGTDVVKNGRRRGRQQYRCRSEQCRHQFGDESNAYLINDSPLR